MGTQYWANAQKRSFSTPVETIITGDLFLKLTGPHQNGVLEGEKERPSKRPMIANSNLAKVRVATRGYGEMADAPDSGSGGSNPLQVQLLLSAPKIIFLF